MSNITVFSRRDKYKDQEALNNVIKYIMRGSYEEGEGFISYARGVNQLSIDSMISSMETVKRITNQLNGKQLIHFCISIYPKKFMSVDNKVLNGKLILQDVCDYFYNLGYQIIGAVHKEDFVNVHVHFVVNNINLNTGKRMYDVQTVFCNLLYELEDGYNLNWGKVNYKC